MSLASLQHDFLKACIDKSKQSLFTRHIRQSTKLSVEERFTIYQDSTHACLVNTLLAVYPVVAKLVGTTFFNGLAGCYIAQTPSQSPNLFAYGQSLADFITDFTPAKTLPYLADICRLEWAIHRVYYAATSTSLDFVALAKREASDPDSIIFQLPAASCLLQSPYPIDKIWQQNQVRSSEQAGTVNLNLGEVKLLIWRKNGNIVLETLSSEQWQLLRAIESQLPLAQLCSSLSESSMTINVVQLLTEFVKKGWISSFQ